MKIIYTQSPKACYLFNEINEANIGSLVFENQIKKWFFLGNDDNLIPLEYGATFDSYWDNKQNKFILLDNPIFLSWEDLKKEENGIKYKFKSNAISDTVIGREAFKNCSGLINITIPNTITDLSYGAFASCTKLISIYIPNSINSIGKYCFLNCQILSMITLPSSIKSIGENAFLNSGLRTINAYWEKDYIKGAPWGASRAIIYYKYN